MRRPGHSYLSILLLAFALAPSVRAQFRTPESKGFQNSTYVGEEPDEVRAVFFRAQELIDQGKPVEAGRELLSLLRRRTVGGLVQYSERLVMPKEGAVMLKLASLSQEALAQLRKEETAHEESVANAVLDPAQLLSAATEHALTSVGERAWLQAAEVHLLSGDALTAAALLEQMVHWPNVFPMDRRRTAAVRLLEAHRLAGTEPGNGPLFHWPEGTIRAGELEVSVADLWQAAAEAAARHGGSDWPTLGGDDSRSRLARLGSEPPVFAATWKVRSEEPFPERALHRQRFESRGARQDWHLPTGSPIVARDLLIHLDMDGLHFHRVESHEEWVEPLRFDFDLHIDPRRYAVMLDRSSLCVHGSLLVLTLELRSLNTAQSDDPASHGAVFGIDLDREAFVQFGVRSFDSPPQPEVDAWVFTGPAVVVGEKVFVIASRLRDDETECSLFAFDSKTGAKLDELFLARAAIVARYSDRFAAVERRRVAPSPLSMRAGVLYACTNLGVVAAVRAEPLAAEWIFRYNRRQPSDSRRYTEAVFWDTGGWPTRAPEVFVDRVLVSPTDSRYLYALARWPNARGDLLLNDPVEKENRMAWIGSSEQELLFLVRSGARQFVQATDHSGYVQWETLPIGAGLESVCGMPALAEGFLFIPTDLGVYRLDLGRQGFPDHFLPPPESVGIPFPRFGAFGDLLVTPRYLVSQSSTFLHAFRVFERR